MSIARLRAFCVSVVSLVERINLAYAGLNLSSDIPSDKDCLVMYFSTSAVCSFVAPITGPPHLDENKLWDILKETDEMKPSPDFKIKFWQKVREREEKHRFLFYKIVPVVSLAVLAILFIPYYIKLRNSASTSFSRFSNETLLEATIGYYGTGTIASELLTPEEIVETLIPEGIQDNLQEIAKGGAA